MTKLLGTLISCIKEVHRGELVLEPTQNLSNNVGGSFGGAIDVSSNTVHVVWKDNTPGNLDILYG